MAIRTSKCAWAHSKIKSVCHGLRAATKRFFVLVEITGPILITVTLLQSMHGTLLGELNPHSFGSNKKAPHVSV